MSLNLSVLLRESAHNTPNSTALVFGDVKISYASLHSQSQRFASALKGIGLQDGEHVALLIPNVPQFTMAYFACHIASNPVVPLNVLLKADEIAYHLEDSDSKAVIVWEGFLAEARAGFDKTDSCRELIIVKADPTDLTAPEGLHNLVSLIASFPPMTEMPTTNPDDTAVILYTSGTTGKAKGAQLTHFNMFYNAYYSANRLLPMDSETIAFGVLPLFHSFGQTVIQNAVLSAGGQMVLMPRFDPVGAMALIEKHKITLFAGVPTMYFALLNHPQASDFDLSSLQYCISGGAAMPVEVMRAFDEKYSVNILEGYGLSETSPVASFNVLHLPKKAGSIGLPIWGVDFKLEDNEGQEITEDNTPGEICIKGHNVMKGYYKREKATHEAFKGGWFHTGDIGTRDKDGFYTIVDRKKDLIIRGGFNIYPREIEEVLYSHPAIAEAAVIGVPDDRLGEEVKGVVALKPGKVATAEELLLFCKERLAAYKYPRHFDVISELPKGPTGKILKRELPKTLSS